MIDITGEFAISIKAYFFGAVIVSACVAMIAVVNTPSFQRSWERMCNGIAGAFSGALSWAAAQAKSIAQLEIAFPEHALSFIIEHHVKYTILWHRRRAKCIKGKTGIKFCWN